MIETQIIPEQLAPAETANRAEVTRMAFEFVQSVRARMALVYEDSGVSWRLPLYDDQDRQTFNAACQHLARAFGKTEP